MTTPRLRYRRGQAAKRIDAEDAQIAYDFTIFSYTTAIEVGLTSCSRVTLEKVVVFAPEEKYIKLYIIVLNAVRRGSGGDKIRPLPIGGNR
jgi:hypothetical protein